ncbi:MAG: hypothetical protein FJY88_12765, partial [Candidatus Eisenbacteria bacterium]|nr:hypothetical protein [Candidatus Eisenbacteria bacterium]
MAALAFGLAALVGGIRALDAQISTLGDEILSATVEPATLSASSEGPQMGLPPHTALMVEQIPKRLARAQTHRFFAVSVTAYTSEASQTDDSPSLTATRRPARPGT